MTGGDILKAVSKSRAPQPRWWEVRRAQNLKPSTYRCPLCGGMLPSLSEHMLMFPEGDHGRRRHAHTACVMQARQAGRLPTRQEWQRSQPGHAAEPAASGLWPKITSRLRLRRNRDRSR